MLLWNYSAQVVEGIRWRSADSHTQEAGVEEGQAVRGGRKAGDWRSWSTRRKESGSPASAGCEGGGPVGCCLMGAGGRGHLGGACPVIDGVKGRRELTLGHLCKVGSCIKPFQAPLLLWWGTGTLAFREPQVLLGITDLGLAEERVCVCVCTCVFLS